jgi:hypothetical protein
VPTGTVDQLIERFYFCATLIEDCDNLQKWRSMVIYIIVIVVFLTLEGILESLPSIRMYNRM